MPPTPIKNSSRFFANGQLLAVATGLFGALLVFISSLAGSVLLVLGAVIGLAITTVIFLYPEIGFLLTSFVVPIERLGRLGDDSTVQFISLMRVVGTLTLASVLLHLAIKRQTVNLGIPILLYGVFFVISAIGLFYAQDVLATKGHVMTLLGNLMFLFLTINVIRSWQLARMAVLVWLGATVLIAAYTLLDWHFGETILANEIGTTDHRFSTVWNSASEKSHIGLVRRAMGTTSNAAVYGINLILSLPFIFYLLRTHHSFVGRLLIQIGGLLILYNLLLTNTRAVIIFAPLTLLICGLYRMYRVTPAMIAAVVFAGSLLLLAVPDAVYKRALDPGNYSVESSNNISARFALWDAGGRIIQDNWLIGIGAGNRTALADYLRHNDFDPDEISVHNEYIQTMMDVGVLGWLFFFAFVAWVMWYAHRLARHFKHRPHCEGEYWFLIACQIAMISVALFAVQVDVFHFPLKGWWLIVGIVCALHRLTLQDARHGKMDATSTSGNTLHYGK